MAEDFLKNLKIVMAPYKVGAMPGYLKTNGDVKKLENDWGDNEVKASALRDVIKKKTGGKVEATDSINNENSLLGILRAFIRMKNYGGDSLSPNETIIFDPYPDRKTLAGVGGTYYDNYGYKYLTDDEDGKTRDKDIIMLRNTSFDNGGKTTIDARDNRFHPTSTSTTEDIATHEFAHAAKEGYDLASSRFADSTANSYRDARLLEKFLSKIQELSPTRTEIYEKAADNAGFGSVEDAITSISGYAKENEHEAFAEAYSDVLLNKDQAKPYSKELIKLYLENADKLLEKYKNSAPVQVRELKRFIDSSPIKDTLSIKKKGAK